MEKNKVPIIKKKRQNFEKEMEILPDLHNLKGKDADGFPAAAEVTDFGTLFTILCTETRHFVN